MWKSIEQPCGYFPLPFTLCLINSATDFSMTVLIPELDSHMHPPKSAHQTARTSSAIYSAVFDQLASVLLPDSEINDLLNFHESLPLYKVLAHFDNIIQHMTAWLEAAQMAAFTLELAVKEDNDLSAPGEAQSLVNFSFGRIEPYVLILDEVNDVVLDKLDEDVDDDSTSHQRKTLAMKVAIARIHSEWANLQCFFASIIRQLDINYAKKELIMLMEGVLLEIDDLLITVFQIHESRFLESNELTSCAPSVSIDIMTYTDTNPALADIDHRIEPLFTNVQRIYAAMTPTDPSKSSVPPSDPSGAMSRMHLKIQQRWETLRTEVDTLKQDLKEERWLGVFQQVSDQVDIMIDGLMTAVAQCNSSIKRVQAWYQSVISQGASQSLSVVDRDRFKLSEKNFEAKRSCYTSAIDKMLRMLGESIVSKLAADNTVCRRHTLMVQRWTSLKNTMNMLASKDLPETRHIFSLERRPSLAPVSTLHSGSLVNDKDGSGSCRSSTSASSSNNSSYNPSLSSVSSASGRDHQSWLRPSTSESSLLNSTTKRPAARRTKTPIRPSTSHSHDNHAWLLEPPKQAPGRRTLSVDHGRPRAFVDHINTPNKPSPRSKTPVLRSKNSAGNAHQQYNEPIRRPTTPSMIPRPKTPTSRLPSMLPRPQSSLLNSHPKTPSYLALPEISVSQKQRLRKKQSMPALSTSRTRGTHVPKSETKDRPRHEDNDDCNDGFGFLKNDLASTDYIPSPNDPLDVQVARIINASPIRIQCQKSPLGGGRYYFGNDLNLGGRKLYNCKLMSYINGRTKVLVRVGGGWQEFEMFLLDHSNLMVATPKVISRPYSSMDYR